MGKLLYGDTCRPFSMTQTEYGFSIFLSDRATLFPS
jgi:hypothetical protein